MIRLATFGDKRALLELKNDPDARFWAARCTPITEAEHHKWFTDTLADPASVIIIEEASGREIVGYARLAVKTECRVSIAVKKQVRGQGIGTRLLEYLDGLSLTSPMVAYVHPGNTASLSIFRKNGYTLGEMRGIWQVLYKGELASRGVAEAASAQEEQG